MDFDELDSVIGKEAPKTAVAERSGMTLRERFLRTMYFQPVDTPPNFEFGYWDRTLEVWRGQGMPDHVVDEKSAYDYFGIEDTAMVNVSTNIMPRYDRVETIKEDDERIIVRDNMGCVAEMNKEGDRSIPHYLDFPIKDRETWQPYKALLDPADPRRWSNLKSSLEDVAQTDAPVGVMAGSLVGIPRNLIGFHRIAMMAYEDPELLMEIVDSFGQCIVGVLEKLLPLTRIDFALGWEDICFNQGPIVPPDFFASVAGPWYRRIADLLAQHGCTIYATDTDGNIMPIADTFIDNGLNTMFPIEVHGGTDPVALREKYGKRVKLWGGVCKMKLAESKEAIDAELARLKPTFEQGGFIPTVDHRVPANVPYELYLYYLDKKRKLFNVGGEPKY